jgi:prevent-host-death family protein
MRTMPAGQFKAKCLAVMDEVQLKREPVLVTKNGKAVAKMVPLDMQLDEDPLDTFYFGKIDFVGDIISSPYTDEEWASFENAALEQLK